MSARHGSRPRGRTPGSAGVIIFLVWLWITNLAILLGLEFDAELARRRAISGGHPAREEPYVAPRDRRKWPDSGVRRPEGGPEPGPEEQGSSAGGGPAEPWRPARPAEPGSQDTGEPGPDEGPPRAA